MSANLPPLRKTILKGYLLVVMLFGITGTFFFLASIYVATGITPKIIHSNYDSIEVARKMQQSWIAIHFAQTYPDNNQQEWVSQFESALAFAKSNITEPDEDRITDRIDELWRIWKQGDHSDKLLHEMNIQLETLSMINEKGMFALITKAGRVRQAVVLGIAVFFALSFFAILVIVDTLSCKLAKPLKDIAEVLRSKPKPGDRLKLPAPTSLEYRILNEELTLLWENVSRADHLNMLKILSQRNQLETLLSAVEDAIITLDGKGRITHVNQRMSQLIGLTPEHIVGQLLNDLPGMSENYLKLREVFRESTRDSVPTFDLETEQSKMRSFEARIKEVLTSTGEVVSTIFLLHDVTEIRQKERLKSEFIGVLSHELKTPLQSLGTAVELLAQKKQTFDVRTVFIIETIVSDVARIRAVANQFVQADYVPGAAIHMHFEVVNLSDLIPEWLKPFELLASEHDIVLVIESEESIYAEIDPVKFPWVISNLLTNSIRVSPKNSTIKFRLANRGGHAEIAVANEGPSIPDDVQRRMFDPYYKGQEEAPGNSSSGYLGLGLTIVKEVTEAHGGSVEYTPLEPRGSCFRVLLPLHKSAI